MDSSTLTSTVVALIGADAPLILGVIAVVAGISFISRFFMHVMDKSTGVIRSW